ncbi:MAG: alkaline phosphatase family protein [Anaerolineae bacterium]
METFLRSRRAPDVIPPEWGDAFVWPDYGGRSLANVAGTVGTLLGVPLPGIAEPLTPDYWHRLAGGVRRVVCVLLDALGYLQLRELLHDEPDGVWARLAARGLLLPMTSIVPSTTNAALATVMTGVPPIGHGLLGYELWLREYGVLAEMLSLTPVFGTGVETLPDWGLLPEAFLPVPGLATRLAAAGVRSTALLPNPFTASALSRMCYRGVSQMLGYTDLTSMGEILRREVSGRVAADRDEPWFCFAYWGGVDNAIHGSGRAGGRWQAQARLAGEMLEEQFLHRLSPREREGTLLVVLADHGFVDTPVELAHDTEADSVFRERLLVPYSGEPRAAFVHSLDADSDETLRRLQRTLGPDYLVRRSSELIAAGLFGMGTPAPEAHARLGHFTVLARERHYLDRLGKRYKLRGRHGGLTPEEMLVPWLAIRLEAF